MNSNYLTSMKEYDYRFLSRLLLCVFEKDELINGCVKIDGNVRDLKYNLLNPFKFEFVKGEILPLNLFIYLFFLNITTC